MTMFPRCQQCGSIGWCNCGAEKFKQRTEEDIKQLLLGLETHTFNGINIEYLKLEDVLKIFAAKKE